MKQVIKIKDLLLQGISLVKIAKKYNVSADAIYNIKHGRTWKNIKYRRKDGIKSYIKF